MNRLNTLFLNHAHRPARLALPLALLGVLLATSPLQAQPPAERPAERPADRAESASALRVGYALSIADLATRRLQVRITVDNPPADRTAFAIPAWTPGYYQVLHFETNIENVHAEDAEGKPLTMAHPSSRVWEVAPAQADPSLPSGATAASRQGTSRIVLTYDVHADDVGMGFFGSVLREQEKQGYVNGASAFLYVVGHTDAPCTLAVTTPSGWRFATPLNPGEPRPGENQQPRSGEQAGEVTRFQADSYDELIDCPLQFGQFEDVRFDVDGVPFRCVLVGKAEAEKSRLISVLTRIVHAGIQIFGAAPFRRYIFFYHCGGGGFYGGLEHRSSTVIHIGTPIRSAEDDGFLTTTAHEFFHAWNVKRLRPAVLGPFDYTQPVRTGALWWAEGVTDYYAQLLLVRAGLRDRDWFLRVFADRIAELDGTPARVRVSLEEASRKAWEGGSFGFDGLSYYLKGSLIGLYFDLRLRELTGGRKSLDDVMRMLDTRYGRRDVGYPEDGLLNALNAVSGADLTAEYDRYVRGTDEIYWDRVLLQAGLSLRRDRIAYLGLRLTNAAPPADKTPPPAVVEDVISGFSAAKMGLRPGDRILRVNGKAVTANTLPEVIHAIPPLHPIALDIERDSAAQTLTGNSGLAYANHMLVVLPEGQIPESARRLRSSLFSRIAAATRARLRAAWPLLSPQSYAAL